VLALLLTLKSGRARVVSALPIAREPAPDRLGNSSCRGALPPTTTTMQASNARMKGANVVMRMHPTIMRMPVASDTEYAPAPVVTR